MNWGKRPQPSVENRVHQLAERWAETHIPHMLRTCDSVLRIPPGGLRCLRPRGHTGLCQAIGRDAVIYFGRPADGDGSVRSKTPGSYRRRMRMADERRRSG